MAAETELNILLSMVDRASGPLNKVGANLKKLGKSMSKVGKSMTKNLTLPIAGLAAASVKSFSQFEAGMSNVATLVDTTTESMDVMGKEVLAIGKKTPVALEELTSALFDIRSAGVNGADAMGVLEQSARLGVAGLGTTAEAADLVTSAVNAFQLEGAKAEAVYDQIFKTTKNGKTTIAGLARGFGAVAGTVAATGTELDEYLSAVSALTTTGLPAAQAHTQLRAVIAGLTRETAQSRKVFHKLGAKDFKELIAKSGGLVPALNAITGELGGNEAKILKLVGSTEAMGAILGLTGGQAEAFTNTLADMREGAKAVDVAFEKQNKTTQAQWKKTKNQLQAAAVSIGSILAPALERVAQKVQELVGWFSNLDEGTKETIFTVAGVVATVGPVLVVLGKLTSAIGMVSTAVAAMGRIMMANPIAALATVIALAALEIKRNWGDFEEFFKLIWDGVTAIWQAAVDAMLKMIEKVVAAINRVKRLASDVKAHFTISETSGEKRAREKHNKEIDKDFEQRSKEMFRRAMARRKARAAEEATQVITQGATALSKGAGSKEGETLRNEITLKIEGDARVKSQKGPARIDVKTGPQGAF